MLEPLTMDARSFGRKRQAGVTIIELMVVVVVIGILLALAAPSFNTFFAKKRVEGVAQEFGTDLQYTRSESVSRNAPVRLTVVSATCYVISTVAVTTCPTAVSATILKFVDLPTTRPARLTAAALPASVEFDPVRGMPSSGAATSFTVNNTLTAAELTLTVNVAGRVQVCSGSGSIAGYTAC